MKEDLKRLPRLTAILTQLQTKRVVTATKLAEKFGVSTKTIYRDIKALEQAGVPILTEEGKGYSLVEGYRIAPVMFTESEANALLTAELLIQSSKDESLIRTFSSAIEKVKAGMTPNHRNRIEQLSDKLGISRTYTDKNKKSQHLLVIQKALLEFLVVKLDYLSKSDAPTSREVEPFAVYTNQDDEWILIAHCRLRQEFRSFLLNRIENLTLTNVHFEPNPITYAQYRKKVYGN
jgi:predicted DNA-binding transcriptional regulator YafY